MKSSTVTPMGRTGTIITSCEPISQVRRLAGYATLLECALHKTVTFR
jgi:hypothetical protein